MATIDLKLEVWKNKLLDIGKPQLENTDLHDLVIGFKSRCNRPLRFY